ncbi:transcription initiation factor IIE, alpha subunit [Methanomethylovorans hollandica DSM 15978]|uniref:Transcription factor E n=1 Tax=Methanomethylovorans hollandica (strain DSM 15978 / NBRC 107637 / DMS1) TaxID=867904 RepID=L0KYS4_METHD|nr:transcription initiation factor IIE, subunit alpha [Methanomethylovorans hollandica]AGB49228.1 transcription initiation factor IIE, alpha subunit [Methanomethylovorans hollandica DSM 15978]
MIDMNDPVTRGYLIRLVGEDGLAMIEKMPEGEVTDEQIAQAAGILLNIVRRTLFILNENKLAICRRERDASSGWLTYLWTLDMSDVEKQLMKEKKRLIKNLKIRKDFEESNVFYICPEGCVRMDFKQASDSAFMCPDCGEDMVHQDNLPFIHIIQERIKNLESR